ncbi:hypothetical protein [Marinomonas fungiae]|uniref:hypothetical protein n=1 Tax=Marinomonas fungiae TaxID=1137284 RepID=UPI003A915402
MEGTELVISLLSDIKAQLGEGDGVSKMTIAFIAAGGALAGTLITSIFQLLNGKVAAENERLKLDAQLKAELISKQRQEWMDSVREKAADLLAEYDHVFGLLTDSDGQNQEQLNKLHLSTARNAVFIQLKLNPKKDAQKAVIDSIESLLMLLQYVMHKPNENHEADYDRCRKQYIQSLNDLFSHTWQRIKRLE